MGMFVDSNKNKDLSPKNKKTLRAMIKGYIEMGRINMDLAERDITSDNEALEGYEHYMAESERCDSKKGRHILR